MPDINSDDEAQQREYWLITPDFIAWVRLRGGCCVAFSPCLKAKYIGVRWGVLLWDARIYFGRDKVTYERVMALGEPVAL